MLLASLRSASSLTRSTASGALRTNVTRPLGGAMMMSYSRKQMASVPGEPPGGIVGTVNEAVKLPEPNKVHGSYHWSFERIVAASIVPLTILPFANTMTPVLDAVFGSLLIVHSHIGLESCIVDYIPKRKFKKLHRASIYALWGGSALALYGLYEFETNDVGITETIRKVWNS